MYISYLLCFYILKNNLNKLHNNLKHKHKTLRIRDRLSLRVCKDASQLHVKAALSISSE